MLITTRTIKALDNRSHDNSDRFFCKTFFLDLTLDFALGVFLDEVGRFLDDEVADIFKF
jgi:hypothetical protein